ncbi:MAG: Baeyer-Villiger monooxygenase, partial [Thermoleophilia bacterium]|nr:Baeyer-Villiger monooxygenase [Thermoleophilia bacterium]
MTHVRTVIVGAGFAGIAMGERLRRRGDEDFAILERAPRVGGVWRDNTYPGCACDVPSDLYSLSRAPNPDWSRSYSPQAEIFAYLEAAVDRLGLRPHLRLATELLEATWDGAAARWRIRTSTGELTAQFLVSATGPLTEPVVPQLPGAADFAGPAFHSARWDASFDARGKRVAVVGTGASAIQVVPVLQREAAHVVVVQRTPPWVLPHPGHEVSERRRRLNRRWPLVQRIAR